MAFNLTLTSPTYNATGKYGSSLNGGTGSTTGPVITAAVFTLEAWVKNTTSGVQIATGQNTAAWIGQVSGSFQARYGSSTTEVAMTTTISATDGVYHHLALVVTATGGVFYVDGVVRATSAVTPTAAGCLFTANLDVRTLAAASAVWLGEVDEVAVSNIAKYTAAFTPGPTLDNQTGLVAVYHLEGNGTDTTTAYVTGANSTIAANVTYGTGQYLQDLNGGYIRSAPYLIPQNGNFTVGAWVKTTGTVREVAVGQAFAFWIGHLETSGYAAARYGNGQGIEQVFDTTIKINDGLWHYLELNLDATGGYFFVDGVLAGSSAFTFFQKQGQLANPFEIRTFNNLIYGWVGEVDEVTVWLGAQHSAAFTRPAAATSNTAAGLVAVFHLDNDFNFIAGPAIGTDYTNSPIRWLPTNEGFLFSASWLRTDARAQTINPGQYFRTLVPAGTVGLNFDLSGLLAPLPQIAVTLNGRFILRQEITASVPVPIDTSISTQAYNLIEVFVAAATETQNRWSPQATAVKFTGLSAGSASPLRKPSARALTVAVYGDSITEGVRALAATAPSAKDTDRNDSLAGYAMHMRDFLGAEVDIIGFGGTGLLAAGSGGVPALTTSYASLWSGQARDFVGQAADLIILNEGTNDGTNDVTAAMTAVLNNLLTVVKASAKIAVLQPFNNVQGTFLQNAVNACSAPARVAYVPSAGFFTSTDSSDGLHPYAYAHTGILAAKVAAAVRPLLSGAASVAVPTGLLPIGKSQFKFVGAAAVNISGYAGLAIVRTLPAGGEWGSGTPAGPATQYVNQFVPGNQYYVLNTSAAAISLLGAQL